MQTPEDSELFMMLSVSMMKQVSNKGKRGLMWKGKNQIYFIERIFSEFLENFPKFLNEFESIRQ